MPRFAKSVERAFPDRSLVVDNGAFTLKAGFATSTPNLEDCHIIPNCLAKDRGKRVWVGGQLSKCQDFGEIAFRRPVEKGFLVSWEAEKAIWDNAFFEKNSVVAVSDNYNVEAVSPDRASATHIRQIFCLQKRQVLQRPC